MQRNDEIGFLAAELNAMCDRLSRAKREAAAEAGGRIRALEQLRHAERLITVGKLAAGVAHELGTPLNIVSGRATMIVRGKITGPEVVDYARSIADQAERMTRIIRQLLDFSRRRETRRSAVDLVSKTRACVELLQPMADKSGVQLGVDNAEAVQVLADPGQLDQVLTNLVVNAIQASPAGSHVTVRVRDNQDPAGEAHGRFACVEVIDRGRGMSEEERQRAFEPFFTTKDVGQGAGLGLSVVFGIVEEHGGFVRVDTELGQGSRFSVYLPAGADVPSPDHR
jgi:signal transduction histidine kinase